MRKIIIYFSFIFAGLVMVPAFVTSTTYTQLAIATLLYLSLVYFCFRFFPHRTLKARPQIPAVAIKPANNFKTQTISQPFETIDTDKREFLKMIIGAGFSFFVFSIFSRRAEALVFGKAAKSGVTAIEDPFGNKIYPAEHQPTDGYQISEIDENESTFYGYINKNGGWYIVKHDNEGGSFRYAKGESNFPGNWTNREHLKYDYFYHVFS